MRERKPRHIINGVARSPSRSSLQMIASIVFVLAVVLAPGSAEARATPSVVVTLKPIHSLVAAVMAGVGTPYLLVKGAGSPHAYALRPSDARALGHADILFQVSDRLEVFLQRTRRGLPKSVKVISLIKVPGLELVKLREHDHRRSWGSETTSRLLRNSPPPTRGGGGGGGSQNHIPNIVSRTLPHPTPSPSPSRGGEVQEAEIEFQQPAKGETTSGETGTDNHQEDVGGDPGKTQIDTHIWLDPRNAVAMTMQIADVLAKAFPASAARFNSNARVFIAGLRRLDIELGQSLKPYAKRPYIVFHDAYQYFERRYNLAPIAAVSLSPDQRPGARTISRLRAMIKSAHAKCLFTEPQFQPRLARTLIEGTATKLAVLDPLGAALPPGPDLYEALLNHMASALRRCLD